VLSPRLEPFVFCRLFVSLQLLASVNERGLNYRVRVMASPRIGNQTANSVGNGYRFIDLFAGMGGFHLALEELGAECVFASENNSYARATYEKVFERSPLFSQGLEAFNKDLTDVTRLKISENGDVRKSTRLQKRLKEQIKNAIRPFDVLCAGFPCQPFSQAGHKKGFVDVRGNLFFDIERILKVHKPQAIFLENVRNLLKHDNENTIKVIKKRLKAAGYGDVLTPVVWASEHGLPQHRPRVFIIGFRNEKARHFFEANMPKSRDYFTSRNPNAPALSFTMAKVLGGEVTMKSSDGDGAKRDIGFTLRVGGRMSPISAKQNWDCYWVNGKEVRLLPVHGLMMQGFTKSISDGKDWFPNEVSEAQAMKLLGNSVAVPAIRDYAEVIFDSLRFAQVKPKRR